MRYPPFPALGLLVGCSTGVEGETVAGLPGSAAWFLTASQATQSAHFRRICQSYGYRAGSPDMASCVARETRSARAAARERAASSGYQYGESDTMTCRPMGGFPECS
jgi:hypothetical protein